jgi:hypothetical protein
MEGASCQINSAKCASQPVRVIRQGLLTSHYQCASQPALLEVSLRVSVHELSLVPAAESMRVTGTIMKLQMPVRRSILLVEIG